MNAKYDYPIERKSLDEIDTSLKVVTQQLEEIIFLLKKVSK